jgi:hypothetical protein
LEKKGVAIIKKKIYNMKRKGKEREEEKNLVGVRGRRVRRRRSGTAQLPWTQETAVLADNIKPFLVALFCFCSVFSKSNKPKHDESNSDYFNLIIIIIIIY